MRYYLLLSRHHLKKNREEYQDNSGIWNSLSQTGGVNLALYSTAQVVRKPLVGCALQHVYSAYSEGHGPERYSHDIDRQPGMAIV